MMTKLKELLKTKKAGTHKAEGTHQHSHKHSHNHGEDHECCGGHGGGCCGNC